MEGDSKSKEGERAVGEDDLSRARLCACGSTTRTARAPMWQTATPAQLPYAGPVLPLRTECRGLIPVVVNDRF